MSKCFQFPVYGNFAFVAIPPCENSACAISPVHGTLLLVVAISSLHGEPNACCYLTNTWKKVFVTISRMYDLLETRFGAVHAAT